MFLYNVTLIAEDELHEIVYNRLASFIKHYPQQDTALSIKLQLLEVMQSPNEGKTFCLQIVAQFEKDLNLFNEYSLSPLLVEFQNTYPGKILNFGSTMKFLSSPISV